MIPHRSRLFVALAAAAAALPGAAHGGSSSRVSPRLAQAIVASPPGGTVTVWVYFADRGRDATGRAAAMERQVADRARERRKRHHVPAVTEHDIPVNPDYVAALRERSTRVRHVSRWLNAVSIEVKANRVPAIAALPFVRSLDVVVGTRAEPLPEPARDAPQPGPQRSAASAINYGNSFTQNNLINTIPLHDLGYNGHGVLIGMLDAGFNRIDDHIAFQHMDIMVTRDFVHGDSIVWDQPGDLGVGTHGTYTLSALGGFAAGEVIGPAWGATFVLARTEISNVELHIEEDHWVAGAEWAESLGVDIISSSLGYRNLFSDAGDYAWDDLDGDTTPTTIAADIAAGLGVLMINSAGNNGFIGEPYNSLIAPSDGDSVLAVGAVDGGGARASFSSVGLAADGRIKPDVMAMGVLVRAASPVNASAFSNVGGTSLSCPLVAGAAALMLEANPALTNMEIIAALRATASQAGSPDRLMGWGIIDATAALATTVTAVTQREAVPATGIVLHPAYPNPFNPSTTIHYELPRAMNVTLSVYDARGHVVATLVDGPQSPGRRSAVWNGTTSTGARAASGVYLYRLSAGDAVRTRKMVLLK